MFNATINNLHSIFFSNYSYIHIHTHVRTRTYTYTRMHAYKRMQLYMQYVHINMHKIIHIHTPTHINMRVALTRTYVHTFICTYVYSSDRICCTNPRIEQCINLCTMYGTNVPIEFLITNLYKFLLYIYHIGQLFYKYLFNLLFTLNSI